MKILGILLGALVVTAGAYAYDAKLKYVEAAKLSEFKVYDDIPEDHRERVVINNAGFPLGEVTLLYREPYENFVACFSEFAKTTEVGPAVASVDSVRFTKIDDAMRPALPQSGAATLMDFPAYNVNLAKRQATHLSIEIVDGSGFGSGPLTMVTLSREDWTQSWLRGFHSGIPLPLKRATKVRLVTDTETKLLERFSADCRFHEIGAVVTNARGNPYRDEESLLRIINAAGTERSQ